MCKLIHPFFLLALLLLLGCQDDDQIMVTPGTVPEARALALNGTVGTTDYVIFSNGRREILLAFQRQHEGNSLDFTPLDNGRTQEILQDGTGTVYDIFGQGRGGENDGHLLSAIPQGTAFWLVYGGLFPGAPLDNESIEVPDTLELRYDGTYDIPINSLHTGAGFGVIAPLDNPEFISYNRRTEASPEGIEEDDILIGISLNGDVRLYPAPILVAHEIVNDVVGGIPVAITYSPLSGSARVWAPSRYSGEPARCNGHACQQCYADV